GAGGGGGRAGHRAGPGPAGRRAGRRARRGGPASMIRPARAGDIPAIHQMIVDLATYERSGHEVSATEDDLRAALVAGPGGQPSLFAHIADEDGQAVGLAM